MLLAFGVLALLFARGEGNRFHLPFGDGTIIAAAGIWAAALIVVRLFDRSLGRNLLALACAALLFLAGARERASGRRTICRVRSGPRRRRGASDGGGRGRPRHREPRVRHREPRPPQLPRPSRCRRRPSSAVPARRPGEQLRLGPEGEEDETDETRQLPRTTEVEPRSAAGRRRSRRHGRGRRPDPARRAGARGPLRH